MGIAASAKDRKPERLSQGHSSAPTQSELLAQTAAHPQIAGPPLVVFLVWRQMTQMPHVDFWGPLSQSFDGLVSSRGLWSQRVPGIGTTTHKGTLGHLSRSLRGSFSRAGTSVPGLHAGPSILIATTVLKGSFKWTHRAISFLRTSVKRTHRPLSAVRSSVERTHRANSVRQKSR